MPATNDVICEASRVYRGDRRTADSHNGRLRAHLKTFQEQGVDLKSLKRVSAAVGKMEPVDFVRQLITDLHYARLIMRAEAQPDMFFNEDMDTRVSNATRYSDDIMTAESRGYDAGKAGVPRDECPYEDGTDTAKAWRKWWKTGSDQRGEEKPASRAANASRKAARGRQMRVPGTERTQASPKRKARMARPQADDLPKKRTASPGKKLGRPKGSRNKPKHDTVVEFPSAAE